MHQSLELLKHFNASDVCLDNQRRRLKRQQQQHLWQLDIGQAVRLLSGNFFFGYTALFLHQAVVQVALCVSIQILDSLRDVQVDNNFRLLERMHAAGGRVNNTTREEIPLLRRFVVAFR